MIIVDIELIALVILLYSVLSFIWGAGYAPVPIKVLNRIPELIEIPEGSTVYDLGAGFGRVLVFFSKRGCRVIGVERDPVKYLYIRLMLRLKRIDGVSRFENIRDGKYTDADVVFAYLWKGMMREIKRKAQNGDFAGTCIIVSYHHPIEDWTPFLEDPNFHLRLYRVSDLLEGSGQGRR